MKLYFIGGYFEKFRKEEIISKSKGCIQNAANVLQENLIKGLDLINPEGVETLNLPFVRPFPFKNKKIFFLGHSDILNSRSKENSISFLNIVFVRYILRFISLLFFMLRKIERNSTVLIYSLHLPFLAASVITKFIKLRSIKLVVIVPDLPEYMSDSKNKIYIFFKKIDNTLVRILVRFCDGFSLLTEEMAENLAVKKYVVIEGVATELNFSMSDNSKCCKKRILLYSGTLAIRYGIKDLISAFKGIDDSNVELWICGDGDGSSFVKKSTLEDKRIKYLGQLSREEVLRLQLSSTILVNPRTPHGEYTKFSFPSKIMEYMSTGRPVIMHQLPGVPSEYYSYCYTSDTGDAAGLEKTIKNVLGLSDRELTEKGKLAKEFVTLNKSSTAQAEKLIDFLESLNTGF